MTIYDNLFPMGLGTNRFPLKLGATEEELEKCADMVVKAIDLGVNYIDTAMPYSQGYAVDVVRRALKRISVPYRITAKLTSRLKTADAAKKAVEQYLTALGIDHASDCMIWSIYNYDEFEAIMQPGGIYEAAVTLQQEGIVDYITFSVHSSVSDIIRILKQNVFSGMMISMSVLNSTVMQPALEYAQEHDIGVIVMNPLAGGFIPQKKENFPFLCNEYEDNIIQSALRFVKSNPAIKAVIAGPSSIQELEEDVKAFTDPNMETDIERQGRVTKYLRDLGQFCTGCKYCMPCPMGINIPLFMQSRNTLLFEPPPLYRRTDRETLQNIQVFKRMNYEFSYIPEDIKNPCIACRACEKKCTQRLNIVDGIKDIYRRMQRTNYSKQARENRLTHLLQGKDYHTIGIWPGGTPYATYVVELCQKLFGTDCFSFQYFNSSDSLQGKVVDGCKICGPDDVLSLNPDAILIVSYTFQEEIENDIRKYEQYGVDILKLHEEYDVPWLY